MRKNRLFSTEANEQPNDLLIDKVLARQETEKPGMSVTAELLQERQKLKAEIVKRMNEQPEEKPGDEGEDGEGEQSSDTPSEGDDSSAEGGDAQPSEEGKGEDSSPAEDNKASAEADEEDSGAAADDVDSLKSLVGSGSGGGAKGDKPAEKKPATESAVFIPSRPTKPTLGRLFRPLQQFHQKYRDTLGNFSFATEADAVPVNKHPVVYAKAEVLDSLNELIRFAQSYIDKNTTTVEVVGDAAKRLSEQLAVYQTFHEGKKFDFTNVMVSDKDILKLVSVPEKSDPVETVGVLVKYVDVAMQAAAKLSQAPVEDLTSVFKTEGFNDDDGGLTYEKTLPGFVNINVVVGTFTTYIDTKYTEYQVYVQQYIRSQELYELPSISMTEDKEFTALMSNCDKLVVSLGLSVDNLKLINEKYAKFIDEVKAIAYDVEKDSRKDLSQLGLDDQMKDFIRFKMMTELYVTNTDLIIGYTTGVLSVLGVVSKLKQ